MKLRLNFDDIRRIEKIISEFTEAQNDLVYSLVEQDDRQMKSNPLTNAMREITGGGQAFELASDTSEWQELAHQTWWDFTTKKYQFEIALQLYAKSLETPEAA